MEGTTSMVLQQRVLKAQVWVITETITSILNHVILVCVMNQFRAMSYC
jgi:hypothetical protein